MVKKILITTVTGMLLLLVFCTKTNVSSNSEDVNFSAGVTWIRDSVNIHPDAVDSIRFTLTSTDLEETKIKTYAFTDPGGSFTGIPAGITISILVEGLDTLGSTIYEGLLEDIHVGDQDIKVMIEAELVSPLSPDSLVAEVKSSKTIQLSWKDLSSNEDGFVIFRAVENNTYDSLITIASNATNYNDTGLISNTTYRYRIFSMNSAGSSVNHSQSASVTTHPLGSNSDPYFVTAVKNTLIHDTIKVGDTYKMPITATDDDGAGDSLTYYADPKLTLLDDTVSWTVTISDTGLNNLWVKVSDTSNASDSLSWTIFIEDTTEVLTLPISPDSAIAEAKSSKTVQLSWVDKSLNEDGFIIYRSISGSEYDSLTSVNSDITLYNDTGLTASTVYYYRVYAFNSVGRSVNFSQSDSVTTQGANVNSEPYFLASIKIALVYDTLFVGDTYKRAITAVDDDGISDTLKYTAESNLTVTNDTITWSIEIADTGLHNLWVKVSDTSNASDSINWTVFIKDTTEVPTLPISPDSASVEVKSSKTVQLTWKDKSLNEDGFIIYRSVGGAAYDSLASVLANITSFNDTGLTPSTQYCYRVYAFNNVGISVEYCQSDSVTTQAVEINSKPYFLASVKSSLVYDTLSVGDTYKKAITATDDDGLGDTLQYTAHTNLTVIIDTIIWNIGINDTGLHNLWIKVSDTSNECDSVSWSIFIKDTASIEYEKPVASEVKITKVGDSLNASYTYSHNVPAIIEGSSMYKWFLNGTPLENGKLVILCPDNLTSTDTILFEVTPIAANDSVPAGDPVTAFISGFVSDSDINDFISNSDTYDSNYRYSFADTLGARGGIYSGGILDSWGSETQLQIAIPQSSFSVNLENVNFSHVDANFYWMALAAAQEIFGYDLQLLAAMAANETFAGTKPTAYINGNGDAYGPFQIEGPTGLDRALNYPSLFPYYESQLSSANDVSSSGIDPTNFVTHYIGTGSLTEPSIVSSVALHAQVLSVNYDICEHATKIYWLEALNASVNYRLGVSVILAMYSLGAWGLMPTVEDNLSIDQWASTASNSNSSDLFPGNPYRSKVFDVVTELESASKQSLSNSAVEIMDFSISQSELKALFLGTGGTASSQGPGGLLQHWHLTGSLAVREEIENKLDLLFNSLKGKAPTTVGTDAISFRYDLLFVMRYLKSNLVFDPPVPAKGDAGVLIQNYSN